MTKFDFPQSQPYPSYPNCPYTILPLPTRIHLSLHYITPPHSTHISPYTILLLPHYTYLSLHHITPFHTNTSLPTPYYLSSQYIHFSLHHITALHTTHYTHLSIHYITPPILHNLSQYHITPPHITHISPSTILPLFTRIHLFLHRIISLHSTCISPYRISLLFTLHTSLRTPYYPSSTTYLILFHPTLVHATVPYPASLSLSLFYPPYHIPSYPI